MIIAEQYEVNDTTTKTVFTHIRTYSISLAALDFSNAHFSNVRPLKISFILKYQLYFLFTSLFRIHQQLEVGISIVFERTENLFYVKSLKDVINY